MLDEHMNWLNRKGTVKKKNVEEFQRSKKMLIDFVPSELGVSLAQAFIFMELSENHAMLVILALSVQRWN